MKPKHAMLLRGRQVLVLILGLFLLLSSGGYAEAGGARTLAGPDSLVRVDLPADTAEGLQKAAQTGLPFYAHLVDAGGQQYLAGLADGAGQERLRALGFTLQVLDPDSRQAAYYLLHARQPEALLQARQRVAFLHEDGVQVIARGQPEQAESLPALGLDIVRLGPEPIVLPAPAVRPALASAITTNTRVTGMISQVQEAQLYDTVARLSGEKSTLIGGSAYTISNRNTSGGTPIQKATQYVYERFESLGLSPSYHVWSSTWNPNVIGTLPGAARPGEVLLITAHLDNMPITAIAPGADDNASGVSGVLMAAQILSQYEWDCTLQFVTFTGEEQGLLGSKAYAAMAYSQGQNIKGVINLDMIAYDGDTEPIIELHSRSYVPGSTSLSYLFRDVVNAYGIRLTPQVLVDGGLGNYSDNKSFWDYGYPAVLAIEDYQDFTPYYHSINDRLSTLNMSYFTRYVRAAVGTAAHTGCLAPKGWVAGEVTGAGGGTAVEGAQITAAAEAGTPLSTYSVAGGAYQLELRPGTYTVTVEAPGFYPFTAGGVTIADDQTTPFDIALQPIPIYTITGYVHDADSGLPLAAQVALLGSGKRPVQTDPLTGFYSISALEGLYTLEASAPNHGTQTRGVILGADQQQDFNLMRACLLVVDDDGGGPYESYYTASLDRLGVVYNLTTFPPGLETLVPYRGVVWLTGNESSGTVDSISQPALAVYLDGGGRLFLSGQNIPEDTASTPFHLGYLHATYGVQNTAAHTLRGLDFLAPLGDIAIFSGSGANNQSSPSGIFPVNGGQEIYQYIGTPHFGGVAYTGTWRSVYFSFGFEAISQAAARDNVMREVLGHLDACGDLQAPQAGFTAEAVGAAGEMGFTNASLGSPYMTYTWNFGDGSAPASTANPVHTYTANGVYTVTLTAANQAGSSTVQSSVEVGAQCEALSGMSISHIPDDPYYNQPVTLTAGIGSGTPPFSYTWDFGDGSAPLSGSGLSTISHVYPVAITHQTYTATLTARNACGVAEVERQVTIRTLPWRAYLSFLFRQPPPPTHR